MTVQAFSMPKAGHSEAEYEDAWCLVEAEGYGPGIPLVATLADGATESTFAALWAQILTRRLAAVGAEWADLAASLEELRAEWLHAARGKDLPWYAEAKLDQGAAATLLGLSIQPLSDGAGGLAWWQAVAIGDCCLFHLRGGRIRKAFPVSLSTEFDSTPDLLGSIRPSGEDVLPCSCSGFCRDGDTFHLMSDALAHWYLKRIEEDKGALCLSGVEDDQTFRTLIGDLRAERDTNGLPALRNDDVTFIRIQVGQ